ncbi:ArnT family glycosyltransferase [Candidatus Altiarchaeota archaeon]
MDHREKTIIILAAAVMVRIIFWMTTPVTGDACFHYSVSRYIAETHEIPSFEYQSGPNPFWWPPLFHILTAAIFKLTGILTLSPLIFSIAGLVLFHIFVKEFYPKIATESLLILSFLPLHLYYSSIGYFETLLFLLSVASYHFYFRHLAKKGGISLAYAVIAAGLSALTHYHGLIPLLAISSHLFLTDRRRGLTFLMIGLLIASPWYARNYLVFGNPIWPKVHPGYYPDDIAVQSPPLTQNILNLASPTRWIGVFFDFWIGAPNSGEDFADNVAIGSRRFPLFMPAMMIWLASILAFSLLAKKGFIHMRKDGRMGFMLLVLLACLVPFMMNNLARMFISFSPFIIIAIASGYQRIDNRFKTIALAVGLMLLTIGSYGYSYTYRQINSGYQPFFQKIRDQVGLEKVIMPFNIQDCIYHTGRHCVRIGSTGGIPKINVENIDEIIRDHDIGYVCCSSMHWDAVPEDEKSICERYGQEKATINYVNQDVWGRCWDVNART